jgi:pilus assembly protein CpaF
MKPKYIIVGEVRGPEAEAAVEGMETGHSTIFTMHGGNVWNIVNRLVTKYLMQMPSLSMEVVERIIGAAVNFICIQDDIPNIGRRLTSIHEVSYDFENHAIKCTSIVKYDFNKNDWVWHNNISEDVANVMTRRGVSIAKIQALQKFIEEKIAEKESANNES